MDHMSRTHFSPSAVPIMGAKGQATQSSQRPTEKITPFHSSPIVDSGRLHSKRPEIASGKLLASPGILFFGKTGHLTTSVVSKRAAAAAAAPLSSGNHTPVLCLEPATEQERPLAKHVSKTIPSQSSLAVYSKSGPPSNTECACSQKVTNKVKPQLAVKRKKRKMGLYNLVPKKKARALKQHEKKVKSEPQVKKVQAATRKQAIITPKTLRVEELAVTGEIHMETVPREGVNVEYTELSLECLDLTTQQELLSSPASGQVADSEATESDLAEDLPLCCCRIETPYSGESSSKLDQTCMAMETVDGVLMHCQKQVIKQKMMRPSPTVHPLVLCEDHRAGMVKHHCCPGCGLFCRVGNFMECRPYGSICHRFHHECASIVKSQRFCPHCGHNASGAKEVTVMTADLSTSAPRSNPGVLLSAVPTVTALPSEQNIPVVPLILKAKKTSVPYRNIEESPNSVDKGGEPKESLENILTVLDDENLNPKGVKYPTRQLYISAKQGELQKVIHLLVDGKDPNFLMEGQNKRTPLHAAAAEGHQQICDMLVQAGANLDMFDDERRTPLMEACQNNHLETVKYLLRAGAVISYKDIRGSTCLHLAAKLGHYHVVSYLISKAPKYINSQDDGGWTPITWAIENRHKELVFLLLARGANVNIRDKEQNVCLHWAALSGCDDVAQALLKTQCDLNAINIHGDSPLHVAARENHLQCVMLFLSHGADVTQKNREGESALDCCIYGSKVWMALNTNKHNTTMTVARQGRDCNEQRIFSRDISRGYEAIPIPCVNAVDNERCPENFKYIPDNCVTSLLNMDKDITHLQHCSCTEDCSSSTCMCAQLSLQCWYDNEGRLPLDFCQREPPALFECNHACSCWRTCRNRVVQNGLRVRLQLFRTQKMGWGVRAMEDIPQGSFVCEYVGEIITDAEADKRENDSFLFTLDNKVKEVHCIDARLFGNIGRFINHLCEPNLLVVRVFTMHQDLRFPRIAFFSSRSIIAGEQIGFDYGDHYWRVKRKYFSCQCGSVKCRHCC